MEISIEQTENDSRPILTTSHYMLSVPLSSTQFVGPSGVNTQIEGSSCEVFNIDLVHYYSFFCYPVLHGFLSIILACLFTLLASRNVRQVVRRQLTTMIFVRVIWATSARYRRLMKSFLRTLMIFNNSSVSFHFVD